MHLFRPGLRSVISLIAIDYVIYYNAQACVRLSGMTEPITKFVVLVLQHTKFVPQHIGSAILELICLEKVIPIAKGSRFLKLGNWVGSWPAKHVHV